MARSDILVAQNRAKSRLDKVIGSLNADNRAKFDSYDKSTQNEIANLLANGQQGITGRAEIVDNYSLARPRSSGWEGYAKQFNSLGSQSKEAFRQLDALSGYGNRKSLPAATGGFTTAPLNDYDYNLGFDYADTITRNTKDQQSLRGTIKQFDSPKKGGFGFGQFLKIAAPIALSAFAPGIGTALGTALGAGAAFAPVIGGAALGAGTSFLTGGKPLQGALLGGASGALSGFTSGAAGGVGGGLANTAVGRAFDGVYQGSALQDVYTNASGALKGLTSGISDIATSGFNSGTDALKSATGIDLGTLDAGTNLVAGGGGGASSYGGLETFPTIATDKFAAGGSALDGINTTEALNSSIPAGATSVASRSNFLSPAISAALGYNSNQNAAEALLKQQRANRDLIGNASKSAQDRLLEQFNANSGLLDPYAGGFEFTPGDLTADPGYQFNLAEGLKAQDRASLSRGNFFSGEALKEAQNYSQGLADNTYNTAFNRALQGRNAGLQGALAKAGVNTNYGNSSAGQILANAEAQAGINTNIGDINANRTVNNGNLLSGALAGFLGGDSYTNTGALRGGFDIQELLRRYNIGNSAYAA